MLVNKGAALDKIRIHHYGVDLDAFQPGKSKGNEAKPVVFLSVARFVPKKGLEYALRAFAAVTQDHNVVYKIIGEGPLYQSLVNLAKELHIEDKVRFEGFKTKPDIVKEMAEADIFVLTSATAPDGDQEGLPVSLIEAQAMSLPVVATSHSGIPELVINHETGLLAPEKAVDQISAHMRALVSDVKLRITLGEKGRRRVQDEFNISQLNDRLFN
jgi:colanic acid/amylovoran biosynthesis glycosyltransferase